MVTLIYPHLYVYNYTKIDNVVGKVEIAELLAETYEYLYNSVPTDASELY